MSSKACYSNHTNIHTLSLTHSALLAMQTPNNHVVEKSACRKLWFCCVNSACQRKSNNTAHKHICVHANKWERESERASEQTRFISLALSLYALWFTVSIRSIYIIKMIWWAENCKCHRNLFVMSCHWWIVAVVWYCSRRTFPFLFVFSMHHIRRHWIVPLAAPLILPVCVCVMKLHW